MSTGVRRICTVLLAAALVGAAPGASAQSDAEGALFRQAEDAYRSGNSILALELYQEFSRGYPLSERIPDIQYRIGVCQYRLGRYEEALESLRRVEVRYRGTRFFDLLYFWSGMASYHLGRWAEAVQAFERFEGRLADQELNAQALFVRGVCESRLGTPEEAAESFERLIAAYPGSPLRAQAVVRLMQARLEAGHYAAVLAADIEAVPEEWQAYARFYRAEALWRLDRREEAAGLYDSLRDGPPGLASIAYRRLFALAQAGGDLGSMEALAQAAERDLQSQPELLGDLWLRLGAQALQAGDSEGAGYFLRRAWERRAAGSPTALALYLAELDIRQGRLEAAAEILLEAGALRGGGAAALAMRFADVRLMQGRVAEAAGIYERVASAATKESPEALLLLAYCRLRLGDHPAALQATQRLASQAGSEGLRLDALRVRAAALAASGDLVEASAALAEYTALRPEDLRAALDLLRLLFRRGEYAEVVQRASVLTRLAALAAPAAAAKDGATTAGTGSRWAGVSPGQARAIALYLQGLAEIALKRYGDALATLAAVSPALTASAGLSVIDPYVLYYRGWAHYRRGEFSAARDRMQELLRGYPDHALKPDALYLAGWCLFSMSDYSGALPFFQEASRTAGPRAERASLLYGKSLAALGRRQEALAAFLALSERRGDLADDALFERASGLAGMAKVDEAAAAYRELATTYPASPLAAEALYRRGLLYREAGRPADAAAAFTECRTSYPSGAQIDGALYWGGLASEESGHPFAAVLLWELLIERHLSSPYRPDAVARAAAVYESQGQPSRALALYERLAAEYPGESAAVKDRIERLRLVIAGASEREAALRVRIDREGGARSAAGRSAMLELAALYLHERSGRVEEAERLLAAVLASADAASLARTRYLLGEAAEARDDPVAAAREFVAAATAAPQDADLAASALYRAAEAMSRAGRREDTRALVERLERAFPASVWAGEARRLLEVRQR